MSSLNPDRGICCSHMNSASFSTVDFPCSRLINFCVWGGYSVPVKQKADRVNTKIVDPISNIMWRKTSKENEWNQVAFLAMVKFFFNWAILPERHHEKINELHNLRDEVKGKLNLDSDVVVYVITGTESSRFAWNKYRLLNQNEEKKAKLRTFETQVEWRQKLYKQYKA